MTGKRRRKISRLVDLYLKCYERLEFSPLYSVNVIRDPDGVDYVEAFDELDTYGDTVPCRQVELFADVMFGKASLNFHIEIWAEGLGNGIGLKELQEDPELRFLPDWVWKAVTNYSMKLLQSKITDFFDGKRVPGGLDRGQTEVACAIVGAYKKEVSNAK